MILEGAGGLLVPIRRDYTYLDLIKDTGLSVIIVAENKLGMINHLMLTVACMELNSIKPLLIVINNKSSKRTISQQTNPDVIRKLFKNIPVAETSFRNVKSLTLKYLNLLPPLKGFPE